VAALNAEEGYDRGTAADAAALCDAFLGPQALGRLLVAATSPCGYLTLHPSFETEFGARGAYMGDLYVAPESRRKGIGRALVAAAARQVRAEGGSFLWWTALPKNLAGLAFYQSLGAKGEAVRAFALTRGAFDALAEGA
jgi:ribosomal protein S18 acetylase RimI-like enzyme